jgi:pyridinium-3,5-biscarboxylic acid mononucleotide sulfurtransferase
MTSPTDPPITNAAYETATQAATRLDAVLDGAGPIVVALSGGVDSVTLAAAAHHRLGDRVTMAHAVSAAVPTLATARVHELAEAGGWRLVTLDAGEFEDPQYLANPVDRCFHCKTNLYGAIRSQFPDETWTIVSGTNTDDLGDYRPGLRAAETAGVRHPFVEAGIDKATIRLLAADLGLGEVAELPASPCLSSRIETGIAIQPRLLAVVEAVENELSRLHGFATVRCRIRADAVVVELDAADLDALDAPARAGIVERVTEIGGDRIQGRPVELAAYRMGSAFVHPVTT